MERLGPAPTCVSPLVQGIRTRTSDDSTRRLRVPIRAGHPNKDSRRQYKKTACPHSGRASGQGTPEDSTRRLRVPIRAGHPNKDSRWQSKKTAYPRPCRAPPDWKGWGQHQPVYPVPCRAFCQYPLSCCAPGWILRRRDSYSGDHSCSAGTSQLSHRCNRTRLPGMRPESHVFTQYFIPGVLTIKIGTIWH